MGFPEGLLPGPELGPNSVDCSGVVIQNQTSVLNAFHASERATGYGDGCGGETAIRVFVLESSSSQVWTRLSFLCCRQHRTRTYCQTGFAFPHFHSVVCLQRAPFTENILKLNLSLNPNFQFQCFVLLIGSFRISLLKFDCFQKDLYRQESHKKHWV